MNPATDRYLVQNYMRDHLDAASGQQAGAAAVGLSGACPAARR